MPRSKVRPNVSTYHEAVNLVLFAINPELQLPLTKKEDKYTAKSLCYLAGMLGLNINAKIQEIYATLQTTYTIPLEFLTWVRAMQQYNLGVTVPTSYGTFEENVARVVMFQNSIKDDGIPDHYIDEEEDQANYRLEAMTPDEVADQVSNVVAETVTNPKPDWDTLAAKNPLAAAFVKSLISTPDVEDEDEEQWYEPVDDDTVFDHHGTWEYPDTDDYSDEE